VEGTTILLVEDEFLLALDQKAQLEKHGYAVVQAPSGEAADEASKAHPGIDLVLMDINLGPGIDGTEAASRILDRRDLPLIFLSSHTEKEVVEKTERITNYGYVVKGSGITVLDASIKMAFKLFDANRRIRRMNMAYEATNEELRVSLDSLHRTKDELEISEEKFSKAFHTVPDAVFLSSYETGEITSAAIRESSW
jgi:DNA-binding response OmpR family regulator